MRGAGQAAGRGARGAYPETTNRDVRQLAEVWRPGVPANKNAEYMARARELNRELETALVARFAQEQGTGAISDDEDGVVRLADETAAPAG